MTPECFVPIPAGAFLMGSEAGQDDERPVHEVEVDAFECAVYPVTQHQYAMFLAATGHATPREWPDAITAADLPVTGVSWLDAHAYCQWRAAGGDLVRLPTEAEWERAARGGLPGAAYPWGETIPGWVPDGGRGPQPGPWPVTLGEPNDFGVYGIGANIHEWCADWHAARLLRSLTRSQSTGPAGRRPPCVARWRVAARHHGQPLRATEQDRPGVQIHGLRVQTGARRETGRVDTMDDGPWTI